MSKLQNFLKIHDKSGSRNSLDCDPFSLPGTSLALQSSTGRQEDCRASGSPQTHAAATHAAATYVAATHAAATHAAATYASAITGGCD